MKFKNNKEFFEKFTIEELINFLPRHKKAVLAIEGQFEGAQENFKWNIAYNSYCFDTLEGSIYPDMSSENLKDALINMLLYLVKDGRLESEEDDDLY